LFQSIARFPVDPIEIDFFAQGGGRIQRNGARDHRKPKVALPFRTRRHLITLVEFQSVLLFCRRRLRQRALHAPPTGGFSDHVNFDTIVCVMFVLDRA
jgi:hypothetical protein